MNSSLSKTSLSNLALFQLAFRPFFLFASLFAVLSIGWWINYWIAPTSWQPFGGNIWWHAHEMIFGFGVAVVAGFLLTAVRNWTGISPLKPLLLFSLFILWLSGRLLISFPIIQTEWMVSLIDISFLPLVVIALAIPIIKIKQWRNLMFIPILLILALLNALSHWVAITGKIEYFQNIWYSSTMIFILLVGIIGGRVIPMFTANASAAQKAAPIKLVELFSIIPIVILIFVLLIGIEKFNALVIFGLSMSAACANLIRLSRWGVNHTWNKPILWSLHIAYLFIPVGFILLALYSINLINNLSPIIHCFTLGAMSGMILAMISRVSLGHTARTITAHPLIALAYALIFFAAIIRVAVPILLAEYYQLGIAVSGLLWCLSFLLFFIVYLPILISKRVDGLPG